MILQECDVYLAGVIKCGIYHIQYSLGILNALLQQEHIIIIDPRSHHFPHLDHAGVNKNLENDCCIPVPLFDNTLVSASITPIPCCLAYSVW